MIPGVNDNEEHFLAIEMIAGKYPHIKIEKLKYHDMGRKKLRS